MLKIIVALVLLTLASSIINAASDGTSINNTTLNNTTLNNTTLNNTTFNNTTLNNTSLNGTLQNGSGMDSNLFDWFQKPVGRSIALDKDHVLADIVLDPTKNASELYNDGKPITESDFSRIVTPPAIGDGRVKYEPQGPVYDPFPECGSGDCDEDWFNTPPW